jgi:hypothetical protein
MRTGILGTAALTTVVMALSFFVGCGSEQRIVRRETTTYVPQPTPAPQTERTIIQQRTYEIE